MDAFNFYNVEKFIFVSRALKGLTLLFIQSEVNITSYASLKQVCIFLVPSQLYQILANRNWRYNEGLMECFLRTREIVKRGKIDDMSLIHYIIQWINNTSHNKTILYRFSNLAEFMQKFLIYLKLSINSKIQTYNDTCHFRCSEILSSEKAETNYVLYSTYFPDAVAINL